MGPDIATVALRLIAGSAYEDSQQAVTDEGYSNLQAGDTLKLVVRKNQGAPELFAFPCINLDPATGHFDLVLAATDVAAVRTALGAGAQDLARCSIAYRRQRGSTKRTLARGVCIIEPEA